LAEPFGVGEAVEPTAVAAGEAANAETASWNPPKKSTGVNVWANRNAHSKADRHQVKKTLHG
jgi:hypothetical protein